AQSEVTPPDGLPEAAAYSIFYENYKNENYESAIRYGRWIWKGMPETIEGYSRFELEKNLDRLVTAYSELAKEKEDPSLRSAYLDTTNIIFDKVFSELDASQYDEYNWHLDRGRFYQENSNFIDNAMGKAAEEYKKAFDLKPEEFTKLAEGYYVQVMIQQMSSEGNKDMALNYIDKAAPYAGEKLSSFFDSQRDQLFDSPEERITFLEEQMKKNPKDIEIISELRDTYEQQDMQDKAQKLNEKLYQLDPSFENTSALAQFAINNANYSSAINYLKEAMQKAPDDEAKARAAFNISDAYLNTGQLQEARKYAREAANLDSDWGQPYIQIASIYAEAVNQCTSGRKLTRDDKVVYWLVLDYLDRAKRVDSQVSNT
ncbi:MAG: tetratricopeptide repeat protein, partial [Candidatus Halalkalibacterium sp. M3_1C_030]